MANVPNFPACAAPTGSVIAHYDSGTHGIVGSTATYTGKDTVYQISDDAVTQCFCAENGQGIQTNWWRASSLTQEEVQTLTSQGWYYIPEGDLWGLSADPYLAKNHTFSCLPSSTPNPSSTPTTTSTGGSVQGDGTGGAILGLAATGNTLSIIMVLACAVALIAAGITRLTRSRHEKTL